MKTNALVLAALTALAPACHRARQQKAEARHHGQGAEEAGLVGLDATATDDAGAGNRGAKYQDPIVYVDGEPRAALAYNELPALPMVEHRGELGGVARHMLVCDYFHRLGVDCGTIAMTHWYRGKLITMISGDELRRAKQTLYFSFTKDVAGKPRLEWPGASEPITDVAVYVHKKAPAWSDKQAALVDENDAPWDRVPYSHDDGLRGVRVSVDGVLRARIKRNLLEGNVTPLNDDAEAPRYRLRDFLATQGVKPARLRGVDLIVRRERVVRIAAADAQDVQLVAARHQHGEMMFYFGTHAVPALAVAVWVESDPPARPMRAVSLEQAQAQGRR